MFVLHWLWYLGWRSFWCSLNSAIHQRNFEVLSPTQPGEIAQYRKRNLEIPQQSRKTGTSPGYHLKRFIRFQSILNLFASPSVQIYEGRFAEVSTEITWQYWMINFLWLTAIRLWHIVLVFFSSMFSFSHGNLSAFMKIFRPRYFAAILGVWYTATSILCGLIFGIFYFIYLVPSLLFIWSIYSLTGNSLVLGTEDGIRVIQGLTFCFFSRSVSDLLHNRPVVFGCEGVYTLRDRLRATGKWLYEFTALHRFVFLQLVNG